MASLFPCPAVDALQRLAAGALPPDQALEVYRHVTQCRACHAALDGLTRAARPPEPPAAATRLMPGPAPPTPAEAGTLHPTVVVRDPRPVPPPPVAAPARVALLPPAQPDEVGRLGGYRVLEALGSGAMGTVFRAEDPRLQRQIALKVMNPDAAADPDARARFLREARAAAALENDHVVTIHQVGEANGVPYLVMPLLQGETLETRLQRANRLGLAKVLAIGREIALGLAAAHEKGLIHRDIKPANLWLEAGRDRVKILDFGLARPVKADQRLTGKGLVMGTPAYMAPEQAKGEAVDHRTDLFSLGCVLYQMTTGQVPFQGESLAAILRAVAAAVPRDPHFLNPEVPPELSLLIMQLMAKEPDRRTPTAQAAALALRTIARRYVPKQDSEMIPGLAGDVPLPWEGPRVPSDGARLTEVLIQAGLFLALAAAAGAVAYLFLFSQGR